jgi:hypothetical protein
VPALSAAIPVRENLERIRQRADRSAGRHSPPSSD